MPNIQGMTQEEDDTHDLRWLRRSATAPHHRASRVNTFNRTNNEASSASRNRGRTVTSRSRDRDAHITSPHPPTFRRTTTHESDRMRRIAEVGTIPQATTSTTRSRQSGSMVRRRRTTTASARPRAATLTSIRPSASGLAQVTSATSRQRESSFSLAGSQELPAANQPYVHPVYADLNPEYENPVNARPVWGLARPLPRVVRPGMIPTASELRENFDRVRSNQSDRGDSSGGQDVDLEDGRAEPFHKLGKIASQLEYARERRESRVLARIASEVAELGLTSSSEPRSMLTPPSEVAEEEEYEDEEGDVGLSPFPQLSEVAEGQDEVVPHLQESISPRHVAHMHSSGFHHARSPLSGSGRPLESAPQTHVVFSDVDDDDASTVNEDPHVEDSDDYITHELQKLGTTHTHPELHNNHTHWSIIRLKLREPLAELLAVIVQLTIGFCADLAITTSNSSESAAWAWGLATMTAVYIAGGISGAHLNPAISLMLHIYRGFPLRKVPIYVFAQILGAFLAACIAYGLYRDSILHYTSTSTTLATSNTASSFLTYPRYTYITPTTAFFNEFTGTAILAVAVLALGDDSNAPPGAGMSAFIIGLVVVALSTAFSHNTGAALNPSRDFGPRLALWAFGYGGESLFGGGAWGGGGPGGGVSFGGEAAYWIWGPWVATCAGALVGAGIYDVAIFVGGESPVNYPRGRGRVKRVEKKWRRRVVGGLKKGGKRERLEGGMERGKEKGGG